MPDIDPQQLAAMLRSYNIDPQQFAGGGSFEDAVSGFFGQGGTPGGGMPGPELGGEGGLELPATPPAQPTQPTPGAHEMAQMEGTPPLRGDVGPDFQGMADIPRPDPYAERDRQIEKMQRGELGREAPVEDRYKYAPMPSLGDIEGGSFKRDQATIEMEKVLEKMNRLGGGGMPNAESLAPPAPRRRY